jgi:hypothetical protein
MSHHQNAGQNPNIKLSNKFFENVAEFRYLGMTVTNQYFINEEMLATIQFRIICLLICCLKARILQYPKLILPEVLYGCEA